MIDDGEEAPTFELPAVVDGDLDRVALDEYLGEEIVILAFYPGDFNPACTDETTGLDELDLFTMQKDVSILAVSGDSVYSHRAFADAYDLHIPLLSDVDGSTTKAYGVDADAEGYLTRRAVVVVDHRGTVEYTWVSDDPTDLPDAEQIRDTVEGIGGDETAEARYRVGHAHYMEGRRAFTSAMKAFEDMEWMLAQNDFEQASAEFDRAADEFNTAVRFGEDEEALKYFERAERKAESLWRAAEWLNDSASAFASGEGAEGESMREDAEAPLESARDIHEPPDPDDFPPDSDPAEADDDEILLEEDDGDVDTSLDADLEIAETEDEQEDTADEDDGIDDEELEEIAAELEEQTEAARQREAESDDNEGNSLVPDSGPEPPGARGNEGIIGDERPEAGNGNGTDGIDGTLDDDLEDDLDGDDLELDLTDPAADEGGDSAESGSEKTLGNGDDDG